ncbi:hypothetical protein QEV67_02830 [Trueperella pyogenes]|nr:hypothetical protein [Trueperella pyogenes]
MTIYPYTDPYPESPYDDEPWLDWYNTPPPCSPDTDQYWDDAYYYGEY